MCACVQETHHCLGSSLKAGEDLVQIRSQDASLAAILLWIARCADGGHVYLDPKGLRKVPSQI